MGKFMNAVSASLLVATSVPAVLPTAAAAQGVVIQLPGGRGGDRDNGGDRGGRGGDRGDRGDRGGGMDRGDRGGDRGGWRGGGGDRGDRDGPRHRFGGWGWGRGFDRGYSGRDRREYDEDDFRRWAYRRPGGYACSYLGYSRGCYTISDGPLLILNLLGDIYCYRRYYTGPEQVLCPRDWYDY